MALYTDGHGGHGGADEIAEPKKLGVVFWICIGWVALIVFGALFANLLPLQSPTFQNYTAINAHPSTAHLLGTDDLGRDLLSRIIYGSRVSLIVGFASVAIGMLVGGTLGLISGYRGGRIDNILNAGSFVLLAFPAIVAVIAIVAFWGQSLGKITVILGVATIPLLYRVVRATTLSFANRDFVVAARTLGAKDSAHPLPRDPSQRGAGRRVLRAHHRGHRHRARGLPGLLGALGRSAHPIVGEHHLRGHGQRGAELQPVHRAVALAGHVLPVAGHQSDRRPSAHQVRCPGGTGMSVFRRSSGRLEFADVRDLDDPLLVVDDLHTAFRTSRGTIRAVDGVSLTVDRGRTLGVVGESGSGKTVLSRSIMGLLPTRDVVRSGSVHFSGHELTGMPEVELRQVWGAQLSMIFQDPMTALNPVVRIGRQITESLRLHLRMNRAEAKEAAVFLLSAVGIPSPEERLRWYPFQLSGGMRQRVMIAIALACSPRLVLADEPTTGLDVTVQAQILDLLADLQRDAPYGHAARDPRPRGGGQPSGRDRRHVCRPRGGTGPVPGLVRRHQDALHPGAHGLHPPAGQPEPHPPPSHRRTSARPGRCAEGLQVRAAMPLRPAEVHRRRAAPAECGVVRPRLRLLVPVGQRPPIGPPSP